MDLKTLILLSTLVFSTQLSAALTCKSIFKQYKEAFGSQYLNHYEPISKKAYEHGFGVEVEFYLGNYKSFEELSRFVYDEILKKYPDAKFKVTIASPLDAKATVRFVQNGEEKIFTIEKEEMESQRDDERSSLEFSSPIIKSSSEFNYFLNIVDRVKSNFKVRSTYETLGTHIHVGVKGITKEELAMLAYLYSAVENQLFYMFATDSFRKDMFSRPMNRDLKNKLRDHDPYSAFPFAKEDIISLSKGRTNGLNLMNLLEGGLQTLEFRLFNGTLDARHIRLMADLANKLVYAVRTQQSTLIHFLEAHHNEKHIPLERLLVAIDANIMKDPAAIKEIKKASYDANNPVSIFEKHVSQLGLLTKIKLSPYEYILKNYLRPEDNKALME